MSDAPLVQIGIAVGIYFAAVLAIGLWAARRSSRSPVEYFLAGRGLGTVVLFMALFGTNCTSFVLVGIPGMSFQHGIGVFGLNAAVVALGIPLTFWAIGSPARRMALRLGALTPAELYAKRFGSRALGALLFLFFTAYTIPYMVQGVMGASLVLSQATGGAVSSAVAGLTVIAIALLYTSLGGMRGTAWTNVFQGLLFLTFMLCAFFFMSRSLGGLKAAMEGAAAAAPGHLERGDDWLFAPPKWASWGLVISLTVIAFPHMLARLMSAKDDRAMRSVCRLYPFALVLLWVPAVMIGLWGRGAFPELEVPDRIFHLMAAEHMPDVLGTVAFLAVLAAVMSTLDAQILTLSSMLVRDVLDPIRGVDSGKSDVASGRWFTLLVAAAVYGLSLVWNRESVFDVSRKAFEGYTTLVPALLMGVRWRRFTAPGAAASILAGNAVLALGWMGRLPTFGFLPVFWAVVAAGVVGVVVSLLGRPAPAERTEAAFGSPPAGPARISKPAAGAS